MATDRETPGRETSDPRRHWTRKSLVVARTRLRRVRRQQLGSPWKLVIFGVLVVVFGLFVVGGAWLARGLGEALAAGDISAEGYEGLLRGAAATGWLGMTALIAVRAAGSRGSRESTGGLLWAAQTKPIAVGLALAELVLLLAWVALPVLVVTGGFALGLGRPLVLVTVGVATVVLATLATAVGYPIGLAVRHVLTRFPTVKQYRTPLTVLLFVAYIGAISMGALNRVAMMLLEPLSQTPPGWVADVVFLAVPGLASSSIHAAVGVAQILVVWPAVLAITRVANRHWFADPVRAEGGDETSSVEVATGDDGTAGPDTAVVSGRPRVERGLARVTDRPTAALVVLAYRRAIRAPAKLLYAAMPFFFLAGYVPDALGSGEVPTFMPGMLLLIVAWAAGVAFVLNPLGDQGSVLPATILSGVSASRFVRAHVLATLLVVLPVGVVVPVAAAVASPLDTETTLLVLGASPVVVTAGSLAGVGIGMAVPRYSSVKVSSSTRVVVPSKVAFAGYTVYLVGTALAGLLVAREGARQAMAALAGALLPVSVAPGTVQVIAGASLVVLLAAPIAGYRYAISRFRTVTLESAGG